MATAQRDFFGHYLVPVAGRIASFAAGLSNDQSIDRANTGAARVSVAHSIQHRRDKYRSEIDLIAAPGIAPVYAIAPYPLNTEMESDYLQGGTLVYHHRALVCAGTGIQASLLPGNRKYLTVSQLARRS